MNILIVIIGSLSILMITSFLIKKILKTETPFLVVMSGSMKPALRKGDILIISNRNTKRHEIGDIIIFKDIKEGTLISHRIKKVEKEGEKILITTKGDASCIPDRGYIKPEDIIGRVIFKIPWIGYLRTSKQD